MKHVEMNWKAKDGLDIFGQSWEPDVVQVKAVVCLVHGIGEHGARYTHVADAFGAEGYAFITMDLRGHGRSGGPRGHIPSIEALDQIKPQRFDWPRKKRPAWRPVFSNG